MKFKIPLYLTTYNSPFKRLKLKWYFGKIAVGVPWFLPRRWVKATPERAHKAVEDYVKREENYNKLNPNYARKIRPYDEVFAEKMKYLYAIPRKIGFDFVGLRWKTKWSDTDYRYETSPVWSFVCFGYQIAITFVAPEAYHYWECYLYYHLKTDKTKSREERVKDCILGFPCIWTSHSAEGKITTDYYTKILKKKYATKV